MRLSVHSSVFGQAGFYHTHCILRSTPLTLVVALMGLPLLQGSLDQVLAAVAAPWYTIL